MQGLLSLLPAVALAATPDPAQMAGHTCAEPLTLANNVPIDAARLDGTTPDAPVVPMMVEGFLNRFAGDEELRKAAKGKRVVALPALASLATRGTAVRMACGSKGDSDYTWGCKAAEACTLVLQVGPVIHQLDQHDQLAPLLAPVTSQAEALGLLALQDHDLFLPLTPAEKRAWKEEAQGYHTVGPRAPWVEIEDHDTGWVIRVPRKVGCGCEHDLVRRAWWVSRDGSSCPIVEDPLPLAQKVDPVCVD